MEDRLIKYETAKLAKEKGFDEFTFWVYKEAELYLHKAKKYDSNFKKHLVRDLIKNSAMLDAKIPRYSAPTQTLLQTWLRKKHDIHATVDVNFYSNREKLGYYYTLDRFINGIHDGEDHDFVQIGLIGKEKGFEEFEEALEVVLYEGLKLIR